MYGKSSPPQQTVCRGRGLNRRPLSSWASTLPLSYPATQVNCVSPQEVDSRKPQLN